MTKRHIIAFFSALLVMMFVVPIQADARGHGFTEKSLKGTYYIPCACEGNEVSTSGSIHSAGMGEIYFDGKNKATITQWNLYTEIGNEIKRLVKDGKPESKSTYSYKVFREGYGLLYDEANDLPENSPFTPSFMITKAKGRKAYQIYLILPQNFIDFTSPPKHLIHVTATRR